MLERKIAEAKACATLGQMKNNKSPGSDGFTAEFIKYSGMTSERSCSDQSTMDLIMEKCL